MKKLFSYENLTPQEQELYRLGDQFFNQMAKDAINKTSQELDGVDRAMLEKKCASSFLLINAGNSRCSRRR